MGPHEGAAIAGRDERPRGSPGYGVFKSADGGYVTLAVIAEDHFWQAVCDALDIADLRGLTYSERLDRVEACNDAVAAAIAKLSHADALARLTATGAPVAPILRPPEMAAHEQFRSRRVVIQEPDGTLRLGFPAVLTRHPPRAPGPAPEPGEHSGWD
jgi:crotonobetainyl-CoA:carnitine CoA-transferase CaiB-like acyl-CoA transferase